MTRRGTIEIQQDLLNVMANGWEKPTHLMYRSNTSWTTFCKHIEHLVYKGLVVKRGKTYHLTLKGTSVLQTLNKMRKPSL